ncbi:hypothetical protein D3C85_173230 [compost metagenome]
MSVDRAISLYDLLEYPEAKKAIVEEDKASIDKFLHYLGFDVEAGYEYVDCFHRPLKSKSNQSVYGTRIEGYERQDVDWMQSNNASWENQVEQCTDGHLKVELAVMGQQGNNTAYVLDKAKKWKEENNDGKLKKE